MANNNARTIIDDLLEYAVRFAEMNEEPSDGGCWDSIGTARAYLKDNASAVSVATDSNELGKMCDRLLDSEEHAGESAVPDVAEDAAALLKRLSGELGRLEEEKQNLVSQRDEASSLVGTLYAALNDAADEKHAYRTELESARAYLGLPA